MNSQIPANGDISAVEQTPTLARAPGTQISDQEQDISAGRNIQKDLPEAASKEEILPSISADNIPYCILPERQKIFFMLACSFAAMISPMSSSIYFPALNSIGRDLNASTNMMNLSITTFMIFQGIAPSMIGNFSDVHGRRPAYLICFAIYLAANIGLAFQSDYAALMVLRCLQSSGSSGTMVLGVATVADISTRAERGKYIGYASMGITLGPALGPVIGGLIDHFLGWRWIFRFLATLAGVFAAVLAIFLPETCRAVVGNGSVPSAPWNRSVWQICRGIFRPHKKAVEVNLESLQKRKGGVNPFASAMIATEKEPAMLLAYGALLYSGYIAVLSTLTSQLQVQYGFNSIQIGLCYLPMGLGSLTSRWTVGFLLDRNFKREAARQGLEIVKNRQQDIANFNIEVARLTITIPLVYSGALCLIAYGWVMQFKTSLAGPVIMLFFSGHLTTGAFSSMNTLLVDTQRESPATAVAAANLWRCLMGAGAVAAAGPLIDRIGLGWTATFIALLWILFSPMLLAIYKYGHGWRKELRSQDKEVGQGGGSAD